MSEDCLYLNIFAPLSARPGSNKAVMVYIHGGYFEKYSSNNGNTTSGEEKAKTGDVIVVTINYRLGDKLLNEIFFCREEKRKRSDSAL